MATPRQQRAAIVEAPGGRGGVRRASMDQGAILLPTLAASLGLALLLGLAAVRLRLPALVGYLLAGVLLGPHTPGLVNDVALSGELAEVGVILLMFGVGLHFSFEDLLAVRGIAVPGALAQIAVACLLGAGAAWTWGWGPSAGLVFGLSLSTASTVVLLRSLEQRGLLETPNGRISMGWLVVEDLAMVLALVLLPALGGGGGVAGVVALTLAKVGAFVALMMLVGRRAFPRFLRAVADAGSGELFTLAVVALAVGVAYGSARLFGVSFALGAFFAGLVLRESPLSQRAAKESLPLRSAFAVLFFVSVGMLFEPRVLLEQPGRLLAVLAIVLLGKSLAAFVLVRALGYPLGTALTVSAALAQIGEFSFMLAGFGSVGGYLPKSAQSLIVAAALISIALNPLAFAATGPLARWAARTGSARARGRPED